MEVSKECVGCKYASGGMCLATEIEYTYDPVNDWTTAGPVATATHKTQAHARAIGQPCGLGGRLYTPTTWWLIKGFFWPFSKRKA